MQCQPQSVASQGMQSKRGSWRNKNTKQRVGKWRQTRETYQRYSISHSYTGNGKKSQSRREEKSERKMSL